METKTKDIFEKVARDNNLPVDLLESIGGCVLKELQQSLIHPTSLAYELPHVGTFKARFKRFENYFLRFLGKLQAGDEKAQEKLWANPKLFQQNADLYQKMQQYRRDKKAAKLKRNAAILKGQDHAS